MATARSRWPTWEIDCRADIYSLGATMYHMATGYAPFSDTSGVSAMVRNVTDFVPDPLERNPGLSDNFAQLLEVMMAKDKLHRPVDWHEVLVDIDRVLHHGPPRTPPPPAGASTVTRGARKVVRIPRKLCGVRISLTFRLFLIMAAIFAMLLAVVWIILEIRASS
ncbi:MAG: hypothetical protein LC725_11165 [Lentisphaerae bacterium]|nr:hypothetical protein [Lentisphaerota bacterium]